ncbi:MAG TPA: squalene/phytoene synthase family protein, partial [Bordetella sp.]|nr:squalene/phytoene synthase family protein [Bordetella sp.]
CRLTPAWRALMAFQVERTRALLHSGAPLARRLPGRIGLELRLVVQGGLRILERIERSGYDVFMNRPELGARDWAVMLWRTV